MKRKLKTILARVSELESRVSEAHVELIEHLRSHDVEKYRLRYQEAQLASTEYWHEYFQTYEKIQDAANTERRIWLEGETPLGTDD